MRIVWHGANTLQEVDNPNWKVAAIYYLYYSYLYPYLLNLHCKQALGLYILESSVSW